MKRELKALLTLIGILWFIGLNSGFSRAGAESTDAGRNNLQKIFEKWDMDGSGRLDQDEWRGRLPFEQADRNKDGFITKEEIGLPADSLAQEQSSGIWNRMAQAWDINGDGRLNKDEWHGRISFEQADRNKDGFITKEEIGSPADSLVQEQSSGIWNRMAQAWDINGDGRLNKDEWHGRISFGQADKNKDGFITKEEIGLPADSLVQEQSSSIWNRMAQAWDINGDGRLNKDEWRGRISFEQMDKNGDGSITPNEMGTASRGFQKTAGGTTAVAQEPSSLSREDFQKMLKVMDMDRDGKISENEWNGSPDLFIELDQNRDHSITADEAI